MSSDELNNSGSNGDPLSKNTINQILKAIPIFKVHNLTDSNSDSIDKIVVFYGYSKDYHNQMEQLSTLFKSDQTNVAFIDPSTGKNIFTDSELTMIASKNVDVEFVEDSIHIDDSIERIKLKIVKGFSQEFSLDETYLFCNIVEKYNPNYVYKSLNGINNRDEISADLIRTFIQNIQTYGDGRPITDLRIQEEKTTYNYDDMLVFNLDNSFVVNKPIGQKFIGNYEFAISANPFNNNNNITKIFIDDKDIKTHLSTLNSNLLLNAGEIIDNNIYLCLATNVLNRKKTVESTIIKIYYPLLSDKRIASEDDLALQQQQLIANTSKSLTPADKKVFESVDLFYNIYKFSPLLSKNPVNYMNQGIKHIKLTIHQEYKINFSLDVIFKIIHASKLYPLIKCNYDYKQENIYRLYTNKVSTDGRKIPYLTLAEVNTLSRDIAKNTSVAVYIEYNNVSNVKKTIICSFEKNGDITLESSFDTLQSITEIDTLFNTYANPLIDIVKTFFEQSGYKINGFEGLRDKHADIINITYNSIVGITKKFKIKDVIGCLSSVFNIEKDDFAKNKRIDLRFKRVSNFNKLTSQTAFLVDQFNNETPIREIITLLMQNYNISEENATQLINAFSNEKQVEFGARRGSAKIKENPGFKTVVYIDTEHDTLNIEVENINHFYYLYTLPIYIDGFVQITQGSSTGFLKTEVSRLCSGKSIENIGNNKIKDKTAIEVLPEDTNVLPDVTADTAAPEVKYTLSKKPSAKFLGFESEGDESENEERGGAKDDKGGAKDENSSSSGENVIVSSDNEEVSSDKSDENKEVSSDNESIVVDDEDENDEDSDKSASQIDEEVSDDDGSIIVDDQEEVPSDNETIDNKDEVPSDKESEKDSDKDSDKDSEKEEVEPIALPVTKKTILKVLPESESESESDEESNEEPVQVKDRPKVKPLAKPNPKSKLKISDSSGEEEDDINTIHDISNLKLKNPYYFQKRMENKDKVLFTSIKDMKFKKYSRMCPAIDKRQPVVLSKEELKKALQENPNALNGHFDEKTNEYVVTDKKKKNDVLKYGADPKNSYYYMCPQYWCLPKNIPLTQEQVDEGKVCGGKDKIIPANAKSPGKNTIYNFFYKKEHEAQDGSYIQHYPGFHSDKTGEDYCIPCCYKNNDTPEFMNRMKNCKSADTGEDEALDANEPKQGKEKDNDDYIKGPEKFPLASKRWGYLPMAVAKLLHEINEKCEINQTNIGTKKNQQCLLRCGVERSDTQSFVACIASVKYYNSTDKIIPSIREFKDELIKLLTLDDFVKFQNGNLITNFETNVAGFRLDQHKKDYVNSKIYKNMLKKSTSTKRSSSESSESDSDSSANKTTASKRIDPINAAFLTKVVQSYLNFKAFLNNDEVEIDYTYLWDMICEKNSKIFKNGANLVILELPENDITNNIEIICPTNQYSNEFFNEHKDTIILMKKNDMFEPIYLYSKNGSSVKVLTTLNSKNSHLPKKERALFYKIFKNVFNKCKPNSNPSQQYEFKSPILLVKLMARLKKLNYTIIHQVLNYQGKVIGLVARFKTGPKCFVPCYPSALYSSIGETPIDFIYMNNNTEIWNTYKNTLTFLTNLHKKTDPEKTLKLPSTVDPSTTPIIPNEDYIPCKPKFRVISDNNVVGILTDSNQFVQISDPYPITKGLIEGEEDDNNEKLEDILEDYVIDKDEDTESDNDEKRQEEPPKMMPNIDTYILNNKTVDNKRVEYIKKIKLETNFYNIFRNSIRTFLINDTSMRIKIRKITDNKALLYTNKLKEITKQLQKLTKGKIVFEDYDYNVINTSIESDLAANNIAFTQEIDANYENEINKIGACVSLKSDKCEPVNKTFCRKLEPTGSSYVPTGKNLPPASSSSTSDSSSSTGSSTSDSSTSSSSSSSGSASVKGYAKGGAKASETSCSLILPKKNLLVKGADNKTVYFSKMADELIRFNRIKEFIFEPDIYLSFNTFGYNLNDNEIILLESLIKDYFKNFIPEKTNNFAKYNSYDTAMPKKNVKSLTGVDVFGSIDELINSSPLADQQEENIDDDTKAQKSKTLQLNLPECQTLGLDRIESGKWRSCFPSDFGELRFGIPNVKNVYCTFKPIFHIFDKKTILDKNRKKFKHMKDIKDILFAKYSQYIANFIALNEQNIVSVKERKWTIENKILDVLVEQGKNISGNQVKATNLDFGKFIGSNEYFLTNLDLWILLDEFKVPAIFITKSDNNCLFETGYSSSTFVAYSNLRETDEYVFIMSPGLGKEKKPIYKIISHGNKIAFRIDELKDGPCKAQVNQAIELYRENIANGSGKSIIEKFLFNYVKRPTTSARHDKCNKSPEKLAETKQPNRKLAPQKLKTRLVILDDDEPFPDAQNK